MNSSGSGLDPGKPAPPGLALALALVLSLVALPAWAHAPAGGAEGFVSGLLHPVSGLDHVLALSPRDACTRPASRSA